MLIGMSFSPLQAYFNAAFTLTCPTNGDHSGLSATAEGIEMVQSDMEGDLRAGQADNDKRMLIHEYQEDRRLEACWIHRGR